MRFSDQWLLCPFSRRRGKNSTGQSGPAYALLAKLDLNTAGTKTRSAHRRKSAGWPCWILFAAWFCANSPQSLTYNLIVWAGGMQHFSHQERLQADVACLLTGGKVSPALAKAQPLAPRPSLPIPAEAVLKKLDLYATVVVDAVIPRGPAPEFPEWSHRVSNRAQPEPLLPPPRADGIA